MHSEQLLHKIFKSTSQTIDKRLHRCLLKAASTLSDGMHLSIAGLGRCLISSTAVKHSIKRIYPSDFKVQILISGNYH